MRAGGGKGKERVGVPRVRRSWKGGGMKVGGKNKEGRWLGDKMIFKKVFNENLGACWQ
jgi:hypothetical protein